MRSRISAKLVEVVRLNGGGAGCHDRFYSRRPVGGEVFLLTAPFIEPTSGELRSDRTLRRHCRSILHTQFWSGVRRQNGKTRRWSSVVTPINLAKAALSCRSPSV